eukprot:210224-Pelagomonas_calceolata.AAC.2
MHASPKAACIKERVLEGLPRGGVAGRVAVESRRSRARASRSMADNPPDPHSLCSWLSSRLAVSNLAALQLRLISAAFQAGPEMSHAGETLTSLLVQLFNSLTKLGNLF